MAFRCAAGTSLRELTFAVDPRTCGRLLGFANSAFGLKHASPSLRDRRRPPTGIPDSSAPGLLTGISCSLDCVASLTAACDVHTYASAAARSDALPGTKISPVNSPGTFL